MNTETEDLIELSRWLMGYVMELHDFRNKLCKKELLDTMDEEVKDIVKMQFPMLQGSNNHTLFRELGIEDLDKKKAKRATMLIRNRIQNETRN